MANANDKVTGSPSKGVLGSDQYHYTLDEIAKELGITRERVRQIECKALKKLRAGLEAEGLSFNDLFAGRSDLYGYGESSDD